MTHTTTLTPGQVAEIPIGKLLPDPDQPRTHFDEASLKQLGESLARRVLVPLLVRPAARGKFTIVDGERRWRAAKLAGLKVLPVLLASDDSGDDERSLDQVAVNQLREQLTTMEVARMLADLRQRHFATTNDLAAALDKRGLPPMTPEQIQNAIDLTALPEWLQAMIDARQVEAAHALKLRVLAPWPAAMDEAKKALEDDIRWRNQVTEGDVRAALYQIARTIGVEISTESWYRNPAHFNPKTVCRGCDQKLVLGSDRYCMAPDEFERKNAEAKAAGLLPGGKKPPKKGHLEPDSAAGQHLEAQKAAGREATLERKAREYLHAYLVRRIIAHLRGDATGPGTALDISDELLIWWAMGRPGEHRHGPNSYGGRYDGAKAAGIKCLDDLFARPVALDLEPAACEAAVQVAQELYWRETQVICHQLWGANVATVWTMDEDFVGLFRKAELVELAEAHKLEPPTGKAWAKMKASELKAEILERAGQVIAPAILQGLYQDVDKPVDRWMGWDEDDDEDLEEDAE